MIENQDELRTTLDKNRKLKELIKQLEVSASKTDVSQSESDTRLEELQTKVWMAFFVYFMYYACRLPTTEGTLGLISD